SLKTFWKSFNLNKIQPPSLASDFGKIIPYLVAAMVKIQREKKNRSKSKSLMGTLKRRLSAKQKPKGKVGTPSGSSANEDTFSSSSADKATCLCSHHCGPMPWPLQPTNSEETCIKMEVRVKTTLHSSSPSPPLNGVRKDFHDLQSETTACQEQANSLKSSASQNRDLYLRLDEHVPVVIGLLPQDYIQYTVPLDEGMCPLEGSRSYCLDSSSAMEVSVVPQVEGRSFPEDESQVVQDLVVAPEIFVDQSINGLLAGTTGVMLQSPRVGHDDVPPLSPLLPPMQNNQIQRNFSGLTGTEAHVAESMLCHLNFDLNSARGVARVYVSVQSSGPMVVTSLTEELKKLAKQGWYWGPITCWEAEGKLASVPDGCFLDQDSSEECYLLSLSFRSHGETLHTRIEHSNGRFSFYEQPGVEGHTSIVDLTEHSIKDSENGAFCYSRSQVPGSATYLVRLAKSVSWFMQVHLLQYLCRFVICQYTRIDLSRKLPLPNKMKDYLQEKHY
uniref:Suppressor of cytokine signaling 6 n=1 Tax=Mandrillus leucophaeus TaxID=9568 RepID=A0A2K5XK17_MANLE